ncbi:hypothetical protein Droror1_Dr00016269 [Drosera rotundifolia]
MQRIWIILTRLALNVSQLYSPHSTNITRYQPWPPSPLHPSSIPNKPKTSNPLVNLESLEDLPCLAPARAKPDNAIPTLCFDEKPYRNANPQIPCSSPPLLLLLSS